VLNECVTMDYSKKTRQELIDLCKYQKISGYSAKKKDELILLLTSSNKNNSKKELGQYFTKSEELQKWVFDKVQNKTTDLLEPSFGAGHLLKPFLEFDKNYKVCAYEVDKSIKPVIEFNNNQKIEYEDFTKAKITKKFKTIIGNPPYIKQKGTSNLYIKFIELCVNLLDTNGELIFIVPSDFIKLTSASKLIEKMTNEGSFTDFYFPNNENLFEDASIDILCFRYEKDKLTPKTKVNQEEKYCIVRNGIITFSDNEKPGRILEEDFNVYVGIVSGKDEVYKVEYGNIEVLTDKDKVENFIYITEFPSGNEDIDEQLESNKEVLMERKIRKFTEKNWFEWGAPRNIQTINSNLGKPCIYVRNMTRQKEVAFKGKVQYFGGTLLCLIPKTDINLDEVVKKLNSDDFKKDYLYAGRFKIGHKQLCNVCL
jgi:adenine-specific DNA-methyltransferase